MQTFTIRKSHIAAHCGACKTSMAGGYEETIVRNFPSREAAQAQLDFWRRECLGVWRYALVD